MLTSGQKVLDSKKAPDSLAIIPPQGTSVQEIDQLFFDEKFKDAADKYKAILSKDLTNPLLLLRRVAALIALEKGEFLTAALNEINMYLKLKKDINVEKTQEIVISQIAFLIEFELGLLTEARIRGKTFGDIGTPISNLNRDQLPLSKYIKIEVAKMLSVNFPNDAVRWLNNVNDQKIQEEKEIEKFRKKFEMFNESFVKMCTEYFKKKLKQNPLSELKYEMALHLGSGHGIKKDEKKAQDILEGLARIGNINAMMTLAVKYYLPKSASLSDFIFLESLAKARGIKVEALLEEGIGLLKKAAVRGLASAQLFLGQIFIEKKIHGYPIPEKLITESGLTWLMRAAAQKFDAAIIELANHYIKGNMLPKDYFKAYQLYKERAASNEVISQYIIAALFLIIKSKLIIVEGPGGLSKLSKNAEIQQNILKDFTLDQVTKYLKNAALANIPGADNLLAFAENHLNENKESKNENVLPLSFTSTPSTNAWKALSPTLEIINADGQPSEESSQILKKAHCHYFKANYKRAGSLYKKCFERNNASIAFFGFAASLLAQNKLQEALNEIEAALQKKYPLPSRIFKEQLLKLAYFIRLDLKNNALQKDQDQKTLEEKIAKNREEILQIQPQFRFEDIVRSHLFTHYTLAKLLGGTGKLEEEYTLSQRWIALCRAPKNQFHDANLLWVSHHINEEKYSTEANEILRKLALEGNPKAQHLLAINSLQTKNPDLKAEAIKYLHSAANAGYAPAQYYLGKAYFGEDITSDKTIGYEKGYEWIRKAADEKHPHAEFILASVYATQHIGCVAPLQTFQLIESAAAGEDPSAQCTLAILLLNVFGAKDLPTPSASNFDVMNIIKIGSVLLREQSVINAIKQYDKDSVQETILQLLTQACRDVMISEFALGFFFQASVSFVDNIVEIHAKPVKISVNTSAPEQPKVANTQNRPVESVQASADASAPEQPKAADTQNPPTEPKVKSKKKRKKKYKPKGILTLPKAKSATSDAIVSTENQPVDEKEKASIISEKPEAIIQSASATPATEIVSQAAKAVDKSVPTVEHFNYGEMRKKEKEAARVKLTAKLDKKKLKNQNKKLKAKAAKVIAEEEEATEAEIPEALDEPQISSQDPKVLPQPVQFTIPPAIPLSERQELNSKKNSYATIAAALKTSAAKTSVIPNATLPAPEAPRPVIKKPDQTTPTPTPKVVPTKIESKIETRLEAPIASQASSKPPTTKAVVPITVGQLPQQFVIPPPTPVPLNPEQLEFLKSITSKNSLLKPAVMVHSPIVEEFLQLKVSLKDSKDIQTIAASWKKIFSENILEKFEILLDPKISQPLLAEIFIPELNLIWGNKNDKKLHWLKYQLALIAEDPLPNKFERIAHVFLAMKALLEVVDKVPHDFLINQVIMKSEVSKLFGFAKNSIDDVIYNDFSSVRAYARSLHSYLNPQATPNYPLSHTDAKHIAKQNFAPFVAAPEPISALPSATAISMAATAASMGYMPVSIAQQQLLNAPPLPMFMSHPSANQRYFYVPQFQDTFQGPITLPVFFQPPAANLPPTGIQPAPIFGYKME